MVLNELNTTQTYNEDKVGFKQIISEHGKYMNKNEIKIESNLEDLPSFYYSYLRCTNICMVKDLLLLHINVLQEQCQTTYLVFYCKLTGDLY